MSRILIATGAADIIFREARVSADGRETGGILLGSTTAAGIVLVHHAGPPGPQAIRKSGFFLRDLHHAQHLAEQVYQLDNSVWIGEWHTHISTPPAPSARDLATYQRLLADPDLGFRNFVAVILSSPDRGWRHPQLVGWIITSTRISRAAIALPRMSDDATSVP